MQKTITSEVSAMQRGRALTQGLLKKQAGSFMQAYPVVHAAILIARQQLNAASSSILLSEESSQRLIFAFADGASGNLLRRLKMSRNSGVAGRVATTGQPLDIGNVKEDDDFSGFVDSITGHTTKSIICVPLLVQGRVIGVLEMVNKTDGSAFVPEDLPLLQAIADLVAPVIDNIRQSRNEMMPQNAAVSLLLSAVKAADAALGRHARNVASYVMTAAEALEIPRESRYLLQCAAALHDVGKIGIEIAAAGPTVEQQKALRAHPVTGYNLLRVLSPIREAVMAILHHHERYDGKGYPKRLAGEDIPLWSRLIAVADAFDHMTTPQPNREALSRKDALAELGRYAGTKYDPTVVKAFTAEYYKLLSRAASL